ncbi:MAG: ATP-binding cassette domain-containing protein, partial [Pseudomonadota bacterium]
VLSQASFACKPGELVVVMGSDASARTAVLDLIDGLYSPNTGTIEHDGIDIRQIAKDELRKSATYAPGNLAVFYGTVAQNFRLAAPSLSDDDITAALNVMGLIDDTGLLPDGIETRLTDEDIALLPEDTLRSLVLARCIARPSSVFLFAEPTNSMCDQKRRYFKDWANAQRGCRTVVVATADRSFLDLADRFIFLSDGRVAVDDTGETGHRKMQAALKSLGGGS